VIALRANTVDLALRAFRAGPKLQPKLRVPKVEAPSARNDRAWPARISADGKIVWEGYLGVGKGASVTTLGDKIALAAFEGCPWRIRKFPPKGGVRAVLVILAVHLLSTIAKLVHPGGVRTVVAESLLLKHQLLISSRSRRRAPNLNSFDRFILVLGSLFVSPSRIPLSLRSS